jgi:hypothetical protein
MPLHCFYLLEFKAEFEFQLLVSLFKISKAFSILSLSFSSFWPSFVGSRTTIVYRRTLVFFLSTPRTASFSPAGHSQLGPADPRSPLLLAAT